MTEKIKVAVMLGGLSAEHDVSILTGLQILEAIDPIRYDAFPVYIGLDHQWWVGDALRVRKNYIPDAALKRQLTRVSLDIGNERQSGRWVLREVGAPFWRPARTFDFDVALPAMHGTYGEDGVLQGVLAAAGAPLVGGSVGAMALAMNKLQTIHEAKLLGIPVLPSVALWRGEEVDSKRIVRELGAFPLFVKPNFLGSSIGAAVAHNEDELEAAVANVFRMDIAALIQPCVPNLVEYNVAVRRDRNGKIVTSAIEKPVGKGELLDFKDKYLSGGGLDKLGNKLARPSEGMASATREVNPAGLQEVTATHIRRWAESLFGALDMAGTPRLDFLCNSKTGEIFFNEINPLPGSFAFFLWEAAEPRVGFSALLDGLIQEALARLRTRGRVIDPVGSGGAIFPKRG